MRLHLWQGAPNALAKQLRQDLYATMLRAIDATPASVKAMNVPRKRQSIVR